MKSKKLIVILSVLAFITVLIVLNSTLFTLQKININWLTTKYELEILKDASIVENISTGESIFLLNKEEISSKLEKKYPYLRVVSIETKFPNKIVIHSAERESLFAVKLADDEFAIIDELGKVLKLADSSIFAGSELIAKPIQVNFNNQSISVNPADFVLGEQIKSEYIENLFKSISYTLRESNYTPTTSKGVFTKIDVGTNIDFETNGESSDINFHTRNGMHILLKDVESNMTDKFLLGLERYNYYHKEGVVHGTVKVWYVESVDKIVARYVEYM